MKYKLILTDDADNDVENAVDFYEDKQNHLNFCKRILIFSYKSA